MEDLVESILDYVRADYTDYAIMLNGEWGSGKTYFWNNKIRNKIDIVEVISNYVPLTQRGKNYFGVCPFHDDKTPSMVVSPVKGIYKRFSFSVFLGSIS